jgi:Proto-chlorophyllide reductase 57 kD subunit
MKFLCVPCDSPMKLQTVGSPQGGSLSVVYSCPECGYEMAMLTNPYETQVVQSLGVRIGPDGGSTASAASAGGAGTGAAGASSGCPFTSMMPGETLGSGLGARDSGLDLPAGARSAEAEVQGSGPAPIRWTAAAEARLANIPSFVRPMARTGIETFARERGAREVDEQILDAARDFFGM